MNRGQKILIGFLGLLMLVFGLVVVMRVWVMPPASATVAAAKIPKGEYDPAVWGKAYPLQYASYEKNKEMKASPTGYGGSLNVQKSAKTIGKIGDIPMRCRIKKNQRG